MVAVHDALPFPSASSIILITSTLGTPPNWLLHAYVAATLHPQFEGLKGRGVVLVSFVNDQRFLREGLKKGVSLRLLFLLITMSIITSSLKSRES